MLSSGVVVSKISLSSRISWTSDSTITSSGAGPSFYFLRGIPFFLAILGYDLAFFLSNLGSAKGHPPVAMTLVSANNKITRRIIAPDILI